MPDYDRFISKIDKSGSCWLWMGSRFKRDGKYTYGAFAIRENGVTRTIKANRQAWRYFKNEEPGEKLVLHSCDNKACVNPDHLYLGDHAQNMRDSVERKTHPYGARNWRFIMHDGIVERVKDLSRGGCAQREIARWLNISVNSVRRSLGISCG